MYRSCSKCGKLHHFGEKCPESRIYIDTEDRKLRHNNKWTKKSLEIREAAQNLCEVCRDRGIYTYDNLEVHHIIKLKFAPDKLLDNDNLICLCTKHHKEADNGVFNDDYLRKLVSIRENK